MLMRPTVFWTWEQEVGTNGVQTMLSAFLLSQVFLVTLFMSKTYMEKKTDTHSSSQTARLQFWKFIVSAKLRAGVPEMLQFFMLQ